uniref:Cytochrome b n=1 Tax=Leptotrombidium akamushi TaxID=299468 RepID=Q3C2I6_9ACAR|nr:cytochrome b [Leptotrombidium akamushi]BAE47111.1 cytochrome b protein [Leptotrombidium akamushi]
MKNRLASNFHDIISLPTPISISYLWNMGSMLGMVLVLQILSGVFISMHYNSLEAFESVIHISRDVKMGMAMRSIHANGASFFFILVYVHIFRGIMFSSYKKTVTWSSGSTMFLMLMGAAFLGYVLPWGQMSFWGATVITSLASAIPLIGKDIVEWLWGGFSVGFPTLSRFFSLHFLIPLLIAGMSTIHLLSLHTTGSSNPIGSKNDQEKIDFHPFFTIKDLFFFTISFFLFLLISLKSPYLLMDPDNFSPANPMSTPVHIQPEWYFLFAYAILRSIPNKLGGVLALVLSVVILFPLMVKKKMNIKFSPRVKMTLSFMLFSFTLLTWIGAMPPEPPYSTLGAMGGLLYFFSFL